MPSLARLATHLRDFDPIEPRRVSEAERSTEAPLPEGVDFCDVRGQEHVKRGQL